MSTCLRAMTRADIALGMRLKALAGWNQTPEDWGMLLDAGAGFVAEVEGAVVGTATVVGYGRAFSWVGMVLVDPAYRRRGIGTVLLEAAIAWGQQHGAVRLDATPAGAPLYRRLGFEVEYGLVRMRRKGACVEPPAAPAAPAICCVRADPASLSALTAYDAPIFGAPRAAILTALQRRAPHYAWLAMDHDNLVGYCLGRPGSHYDQLGPLVADDVEVARTLLRTALTTVGQRDVILDAPAASPLWHSFLQEQGFIAQRPFTRMHLGGAAPFDKPQWQFAIAGPELG